MNEYELRLGIIWIEERNTRASTPEDVSENKGSSLSILKDLKELLG